MKISIRILGLDILELEVTTDETEPEDIARDLSGGNLGVEHTIDTSGSDRFMGFTNGMDDPGEDRHG